MAFPEDPLRVKVEIALGADLTADPTTWTWTDVTQYVYTRDAIEIERGYQDEQSRPQPSECRMTVNNRDGRWSPRNPSSPWYGQLRRGTPIRVRVTDLDVSEDFEDESLNITVTDGDGTPNWARDQSQAHGGSWSFGCEGVSINNTSAVDITVPAGTSLMSFWSYRATAVDTLTVEVDGTEVLETSGDVTQWAKHTISVEGATTVTFVHNEFGGMQGASYIDDIEFICVRYAGYIWELPTRWDVSGKDVYTPLVARGLMYRLGLPDSPVDSPLRAAITASGPYAYYPCEDGPDCVSAASALPGQPPLTVAGANPAGSADFGAVNLAPGSKPLPAFKARYLRGQIAPTAVDNKWTVEFVHGMAGTVTSGLDIYTLPSGGTWLRVNFTYVPDDLGGPQTNLTIWEESESSSSSIDDAQTSVDTYDLLPHHTRLTMQQDGSDIDWEWYLDGESVASGTLTSKTLSRIASIEAPNATSPNVEATFGHFAFYDFIADGNYAAVDAFPGEEAHERIERLCAQEAVPVTIVGTSSTVMGRQPIDKSFMELLEECAAADMGWLYEGMDHGLRYRTRSSVYNQLAVLELDYEGEGEVAPPLTPTDDDQQVVNDVEVRTPTGSSFRMVDDASISASGRQRTSVEVNIPEGDVENQAGWRLHL